MVVDLALNNCVFIVLYLRGRESVFALIMCFLRINKGVL